LAQAAQIPPSEPERLAALRSYNVLDTNRESAFDDLTLIAAQICGVPIALVSLVDATRQWFKSEFGLGVSETPRAVSFCAHAILQDDVFIVPDAKQDPRFHDNDLVTGFPHLRFYAGAPLQTPDGHALGTLCVLDRVPRELSEDQRSALAALARQAMAKIEMRRALEEAERVIQYRSRLMAVMGHDLQQPVNILSMSLSLIEEALDGKEEDTVGYARTAIDQLSNELSTLARASRLDQESVKIERFSVQHFLDSVFNNWSMRARRKGLTLEIEPSSATADTDQRMLFTIVGNLVGNAIKYTKSGSVGIACRQTPAGLAIEISDTGIGIPESQLERIFKSFHQIDSANSEGLGLGLAIVQRTADLIGCKVSLESEMGKGSRFTVTIPETGIA
jgi:signal transduction histidine kinase